MARIVVKARRLRRALKKAENAAVNMKDVWEDIGEELLQSVQANFDAEGRPTRWPALNAQYKAQRKPGKILTLGSHLRNSITPKASTTKVVVGTNLEYAAIHQFGGKTKAHVIKPKRKKALWWPGGTCGSFTSAGRSGGAYFTEHPLPYVNHPGSKIPARPYLMVQAEDWPAIEAIIQEHIVGELAGAG